MHHEGRANLYVFAYQIFQKKARSKGSSNYCITRVWCITVSVPVDPETVLAKIIYCMIDERSTMKALKEQREGLSASGCEVQI
jgi:hypothetical protein